MSEQLVKTLSFGIQAKTLSGYRSRVNELVPLTEDKRKELLTLLRQESSNIGAIKNIAVAQMYLSNVLDVPKEIADTLKPNYKPIMARIEKPMLLSSSIYDTSLQETRAQFSGQHKKDLLGRGSKQLASFRMDGTCPLPLRDGASNVVEREDGFWYVAALLSREYAKAHDLPTQLAFKIYIKPKDQSSGEELRRMVDGTYDLRSSKLLRTSRGDWQIRLTFKFTPTPRVLDESVFMGIDLGLNNPAAVAICKDGKVAKWAQLVGNAETLQKGREQFSGAIKRHRIELYRKDGCLGGEARSDAYKHLQRLRKQERNFVRTKSYEIAAKICDIARRNKAKYWVLEDLDLLNMKSKEDNQGRKWFARNWAVGVVIQCIEWQAKKFGAEIIRVNPAYTSQTCSVCGQRGKREGDSFDCGFCGHHDHADKNAARNIAALGHQSACSMTN